MIVGWIDVALLAADIKTDVADGMFVGFALLHYSYFQKFCIALTLFLALLSHPRFLLILILKQHHLISL